MTTMEDFLASLTTIGDFAKKLGVTSGAVDTWVKETGTKPVATKGNLRLFLVADLEKAELEKGRVGQTIRDRGYVHPDTYKALESRYWESVRVSSETKVELDKALADLELARRTVMGDTAEDYARLQADLETVHAELEKANQCITEQNAVIVRVSVENNGFVEEIDELKGNLSELMERYREAGDKIVQLEATVANFDLSEDGDPDEKLSDAYAEIQGLKEKLRNAEAYTDSIITGESASV